MNTERGFDNESWPQHLHKRCGALRNEGLWRDLRPVNSPQGTRIECNGRQYLNFSSNDYLGLANDHVLQEAAIRAVRDFGTGSGASRLVCGSLAPHQKLEAALADFKGTEAALAFSSGYAAAVGTVAALMGKQDFIIADKLIHACLVDGARLSGASIRVFAHNDLSELESQLKQADEKRKVGENHILIMTESVFSMDGDQAPLDEIVKLKEKYGAWLLVDEAHATGLFGDKRQGLVAAHGLSGQVEIQMGTLGKSLGSSGGFIAGPRPLADYLVQKARSFMFSTAPQPCSAAAASAAIRLVQSREGLLRCQALWDRIQEARDAIQTGVSAVPMSAIIPIRIGSETAAMDLSKALLGQDLFVPAIRFPSVPRGQARLRVTLSAAHTREDVTALSSTLNSLA